MFEKTSKVVEKQGEYGLSITTKFNCKELASLLLNTCGNGSYVKRVPDFAFTAPEEFKAGLFQGYFDGDGSVFISKEKHWRNNNIFPVIHFRFSGTKAFLNVLDEKINLSGRLVQAKGSKVYELSYKRNKKANLFYNYLYKDATIFLERKKEIFKTHLQEKGSETIIS